MPRNGRQCRQQRQRIKIAGILRPPPNRGNRTVPKSQRVGQEHKIEFAPFGELSEFDVVAKVRAGVDLRFWV